MASCDACHRLSTKSLEEHARQVLYWRRVALVPNSEVKRCKDEFLSSRAVNKLLGRIPSSESDPDIVAVEPPSEAI